MRNIFWSMTLVVACLFGAATVQAQKQVTANNAIVPGEVWNDGIVGGYLFLGLHCSSSK